MNKPVEEGVRVHVPPITPFVRIHRDRSNAQKRPRIRIELAQLSDCRVCLVRNDEQLRKAVAIRVQAYKRHLPTIAEQLSEPEAADRSPDAVVLLAESRETGEPLGTVRIQTNVHEPNEFERELDLPEKYKGTTIAHITRLGVRSGRGGTAIKVALFKALYRYCLATQVRWLMVAGIPPIDRQYVQLDFEDVFGEDKLVPLPSSRGIPTRVMAFEVPTAERRWLAAHHPFYKYMFVDFTPDIEIFSSVSGMWASPRDRESKASDPMPIHFNVPIV